MAESRELTKMRLTVLYDAYLTTFRDDVYVNKGVYLEIEADESEADPPECRACFLGTLFLAQMLGHDGEITLALNDPSPRAMVAELNEVFDDRTLAYAEMLFEGYAHVHGALEDFWTEHYPERDEDALVKAVQGPRISSPVQARKILMHLIENEGVFDLASFPTTVGGVYSELSDKARAVLRHHQIIPAEEKSGD